MIVWLSLMNKNYLKLSETKTKCKIFMIRAEEGFSYKIEGQLASISMRSKAFQLSLFAKRPDALF